MRANDRADSGRAELGFAGIVRHQFAFLALLGFTEIEALPTIVRFRRGEVDLNIYHGRQSYEVGFQVGRREEHFSISELIRAVDPIAAAKYRNPSATTSEALASGVERVAELVRQYGERALRGDSEFFENLESQKRVWAKAYELDVLVAQTRPKADKAFREGRYREAAELYEKIAVRLTPTERAKLAAARRRS